MDEIVLLFDRSCLYTTGHYIERAARKRGLNISPRFMEIPEHPGRVSEIIQFRNDDTPLIKIDDSTHWSQDDRIIEAWPRRCFWAIDTHTAWERCLEIARHFPLVYAAQHDGTEALRAEGINAHWLPVAAEPDGHHRDRGVERDIDVAFVGNQLSEARREVLRLVDAAFDNFALDNSGDPERISELYSRAKVVINHSIRNDVNMRIFEAASCGAMVVTNRIDLSQWADLDLTLSVYDKPDGVVSAIQAVLDYTDGWPRDAARRNQQIIAERHTYAHRLETMLAGLAELS